MSERFLIILALVAVAATAIYLLRDHIPSPAIDRDRPFMASNKHRVIPALEGGNAFEVMSQPGAAGPQYFCAAAEYAQKVLRADLSDVIVTTTAEAPSRSFPRHRSVMFELRDRSEPGETLPGVTVDVSLPGQARTVALALQFCR